MEHDIGCKIKAARIEKKLTQEQVAELLGVSRQTISNWENEKSYPDIISVIKMSECYDVSLDYLLKGEQKMKSRTFRTPYEIGRNYTPRRHLLHIVRICAKAQMLIHSAVPPLPHKIIFDAFPGTPLCEIAVLQTAR